MVCGGFAMFLVSSMLVTGDEAQLHVTCVEISLNRESPIISTVKWHTASSYISSDKPICCFCCSAFVEPNDSTDHNLSSITTTSVVYSTVIYSFLSFFLSETNDDIYEGWNDSPKITKLIIFPSLLHWYPFFFPVLMHQQWYNFLKKIDLVLVTEIRCLWIMLLYHIQK